MDGKIGHALQTMTLRTLSFRLVSDVSGTLDDESPADRETAVDLADLYACAEDAPVRVFLGSDLVHVAVPS